VLLITFLLTVFTNLTIALEVGLILALILFVKRMGELSTVAKVLPDPNDKHEKVATRMVSEGHDCPQISMYTIEGPLFFGSANRFEKSMRAIILRRPKTVLLRMGRVPFMDTTGEFNLDSVVKHFKRLGGIVLLSGIQPQPLEVLKRTGLYELIGSEHVFEHTGDAINYALVQLDHNKCLGCKHFAFRECTALSSPESPRKLSGTLKQLHSKGY
jgi:SulP family sulfate permease